MQFDWLKLGIALAVLIVMSALLILIFPVTTQNQDPKNYDFNTHSYKAETNWVAPIGIILVTIVLFVWLVSSSTEEKSKIRDIENIIKDSGLIKEKLAKKYITYPMDIRFEGYIGEYSIGDLGMAVFLNKFKELVFTVFILNDNYEETSLRKRFECPMTSISYNEFSIIKSSQKHVLPQERGSLETKIKNLYKEFEGKDEGFVDSMIKRGKGKAEDEEEEDEG